jgi:hypothetical protein
MLDARLATQISGQVNRRLRTLVLISGGPLNAVLDGLLDKALPPADELAAQLAAQLSSDSQARREAQNGAAA